MAGSAPPPSSCDEFTANGDDEPPTFGEPMGVSPTPDDAAADEGGEATIGEEVDGEDENGEGPIGDDEDGEPPTGEDVDGDKSLLSGVPCDALFHGAGPFQVDVAFESGVVPLNSGRLELTGPRKTTGELFSLFAPFDSFSSRGFRNHIALDTPVASTMPANMSLLRSCIDLRHTS